MRLANLTIGYAVGWVPDPQDTKLGVKAVRSLGQCAIGDFRSTPTNDGDRDVACHAVVHQVETTQLRHGF